MGSAFSRKTQLAAGGVAIMLVVLCVFAHREPRFPGDLRLTLLLQSVGSQTLDSIMRWVSYVSGDWRAPVLIIVGSIVIWRCIGTREAALVLLTWLSSPIQSVLKLIIGRPRPTPDLIRVFQLESGNSFPSGHAFLAIVFWGLIAYLLFTRVPARSLRVLAILGCLTVVLLIGVSRVYLGAHWPSDVVGGYLLGGAYLSMLVWLYLKLTPHPGAAS